MSDKSQTTASPADRFAAIMWGYFIEGCSIDGVDLQEAIEKSGLGEHRPATAKDIKGKWEGEVEVGDPLTFLTPEGKACVDRGAKEVCKMSDPVSKTTARNCIADAMKQAEDDWPVTIEFENGDIQVCHSAREIPHGVPFRTAGSSEQFRVVGTL